MQVPLTARLQYWDKVEDKESARPMRPQPGFASVFMTDEWRRFVERVYGHAFFPLHLVLASGTRVDIPSHELSRRLGLFHVLYSTPPYHYGGLFADAPLQGDELAEVFERVRRRRDIHSLTVAFHPLDPLAQIRLPGTHGWVLCESSTHVLDLSSGFSLESITTFPPNQRRKVRRAQYEGIVAQRERGKRSLDDFHRMYLEGARRWGIEHAEPREVFDGLEACLGDKFSLWIARLQRKAVAGAIVLSHCNTAYLLYEVSSVSHWGLRPNNLLYAAAIDSACREGLQFFDFLPSDRLSGVEAFKESFGAVKLKYNVYRIPGRLYSGCVRIANTVLRR
jgi:hypothetical protein